MKCILLGSISILTRKVNPYSIISSLEASPNRIFFLKSTHEMLITGQAALSALHAQAPPGLGGSHCSRLGCILRFTQEEATVMLLAGNRNEEQFAMKVVFLPESRK